MRNASQRAEGFQNRHHLSRPYVLIFQSEMEAIAGLAVSAGAIETGGDLYGLFSHARRPVISLAVPAAPGAVHERAHFRQDHEYIMRVGNKLRKACGIQYLGNHHSHHVLGLRRLSGGDIQSTHVIARKNGYRNMCQILVTFDEPPGCAKGDPGQHEGFLSRFRCEKGDAAQDGDADYLGPPTLQAFYYEDAMNGHPIQCPIKVIPGTSPMRAAVSSLVGMPGLGRQNKYPMHRIRFDSLADETPSPPRIAPTQTENDAFLDHLKSQSRFLPIEVREEITVKRLEDAAIVSMPLTNSQTLVIAIRLNAPHEMISVMIGGKTGPEEPMEVTEKIIPNTFRPSISTVYRSAVRLLEEMEDNQRKEAVQVATNPVETPESHSSNLEEGKSHDG